MALQPVVAQVDVLHAQVRDGKVDAFYMPLDRHTCFDVFGDVPACVAGTISIVNGDQYVDLPSREFVLLDEASIDGAARAAAIQESSGAQCFRSCDGVQDDVHEEVALRAFLTVDDDGRLTKFVKSFSSILSSKPKLFEEFVCHFGALVLVYPYCKGGTGSVVVSCFANRTKRPVDLKGSEPSVRGLFNLHTGRRRHSYRR